MTVIRKGKRVHIKDLKKKLIFIGSLILVISIFFFGVILYRNYVEKMNARRNMVKQIDAAVLVSNCRGGEVMKEGDVKSVTLQMKEAVTVCSVKEALGKRLKVDLAGGTILSSDMFEDENRVADDMRMHAYTCIDTSEQLCEGDYVDIRIHFSNGADYIVLPKKRVLLHTMKNEDAQTVNSLSLEMSEMDILLLSSAVVDAFYDEHSSIYAIQYVSNEQKAAMRTYPENPIVHELIREDPNIVVRAEYILSNRIRERVSSELKEYTQKTGKEKVQEKKEAGYAKESQDSNIILDREFID